MFRTVLVANRGEIAARVIAACQELGIRAVAVYSEVDREALHVRLADAAVPIGPAPARESYLNIPAIIAAARAAGAEAIHPGYGFLSENPEFAEACAAAGVVFIGPPPAAMRLMASKTAAKRAVEAAGVPTVPGYAGDERDEAVLLRQARRVGFPVMLKASAGGGGKGMRIVREPATFGEALAAARREALAAFGDDRVFIERLVEAPRHIEFQILADQHGNVVHLGERECSIQRRHQKIIEESPSVALSPALREEMGAAAVRAAKAAGYVNAGTCEFLLDGEGRYYFLEMNTRLQVEHPVTEAVTGVDLVRLQLAIAAGEPLPFTQQQVRQRGHAIEARLYAEDPAHEYLPSTGTVLVFDVPRAPGVRLDTGVAAGDEVTVHYDPMLAKLIVYGPDRATAVARLAWALERCAVLGIATNLPLLRAIAVEADFQAGRTTTAYLDQHALAAAGAASIVPAEVLRAAALWEATGEAAPASRPGPYNPWRGGGSAGLAGMRTLRYRCAGRDYRLTVTTAGSGGGYCVASADTDGMAPEPVTCAHRAGGVLIVAQGQQRELFHIAVRGSEVLVAWRGGTYTLAKPRALDVESTAHGTDMAAGRQALVAPMAGTVIKVNVAVGDAVAAHQTLVVLGAMKMEHAIVAPYAGRVLRVTHVAGDVVPGGEVLVELEAEGAEALPAGDAELAAL
jgi:3-methylcrotonyl-CoA carboxylase alpha subunit